MVEGGLPGWGPEMIWVDRWLEQGWAGPLGSVFFCLNCQLTEHSLRTEMLELHCTIGSLLL